MTTKSTVAQLIVAEHFREQIGGFEEEEETEETTESLGEATTDENGQNGEMSETEETLEKYSEHWYEPDGEKHDYAVNSPHWSDEKRKYYKTAEGAADRLIEWYG